MSWTSDKTGRPKEEGGHERRNFSLNKKTCDAIDKIIEGGGKASKWIEKELKPAIEQLDPGEAAKYVWEIEAYLRQVVNQAIEEGKLEKAKAILSVGISIKDHAILVGIPPASFESSREEKFSLWKGIKNLSFWNYLRWRKEYDDQKLDRNIRELEARIEIRRELMNMREDECTEEKEWEITQKWRRRYGLDQ